MLYRRDAIAFLVPNGHNSLSQEVKALLFSTKHAKADYCPNYRDDEGYNDEPILWINNGDLDAVLQNSDFWNCLISKNIVSYNNFNIKTKSNIFDTPNDSINNDNSMVMIMCDDSSLISSDVEYLPDRKSVV